MGKAKAFIITLMSSPMWLALVVLFSGLSGDSSGEAGLALAFLRIPAIGGSVIAAALILHSLVTHPDWRRSLLFWLATSVAGLPWVGYLFWLMLMMISRGSD